MLLVLTLLGPVMFSSLAGQLASAVRKCHQSGAVVRLAKKQIHVTDNL